MLYKEINKKDLLLKLKEIHDNEKRLDIENNGFLYQVKSSYYLSFNNDKEEKIYYYLCDVYKDKTLLIKNNEYWDADTLFKYIEVYDGDNEKTLNLNTKSVLIHNIEMGEHLKNDIVKNVINSKDKTISFYKSKNTPFLYDKVIDLIYSYLDKKDLLDIYETDDVLIYTISKSLYDKIKVKVSNEEFLIKEIDNSIGKRQCIYCDTTVVNTHLYNYVGEECISKIPCCPECLGIYEAKCTNIFNKKISPIEKILRKKYAINFLNKIKK